MSKKILQNIRFFSLLSVISFGLISFHGIAKEEVKGASDNHHESKSKASKKHEDPASEEFIKKIVDEIQGIIANQEKDEEKRKKEFSETLVASFDIPHISSHCLGKMMKNKIEKENKTKEFEEAFKNYMLRIYATKEKQDKFSDYKCNIQSSNITKDKTTTVRTIFKPAQGESIKVVWKINNKKIIDIIIENISQVISTKDQMKGLTNKYPEVDKFIKAVRDGGGQN